MRRSYKLVIVGSDAISPCSILALSLVLWVVNIQELSPDSRARLSLCLFVIQALSKCNLVLKIKGPYIWEEGRGVGLACITKAKHHAKCPYSINIIINKIFKINSISMTLTSGSPSGVGDDILSKLKPVSDVIKYKVNLYKAL